MSVQFKKEFPFEKRLSESTRILEKYDTRVPIIVTSHKTSRIAVIDKNKYLVPHDLTVGQFLHVIRKRIKIGPSESIFLYVNDNILTPTSSTMVSLYKQHKDDDGFLYLSYCGENTFGVN
jgi:GABA(A) receptor-associated protein